MLKKQLPFTTTFGGVITILIIGVALIVIMFKLQSVPATKIVLMGDSITESWSSYSPDFFSNNSYLINKGISGETTSQMLDRFDSDVLSLKPESVIILAGINDIAQNTGYISVSEIFYNVVLMTNLAQKTHINPVLCSVLPANKLPWRPDIKPAELVIELNQKIKNYCKENNIVYLDYFSSMVGEKKELRPELTYDGVHPNKEGYIIMEELLETVLKKF
ncbi:MAG: acylhydrolase [Pelagibacterales bacterium]|nr:acylhydrolase [Pelagibacterales bacterium]